MTETIVKKTKFEWNRSYSSFTEDQAVARIKKDFADIFNSLVQIEELVDFSSVTHKTVNIKDTLYEDLCICIEVEDFPGAATKSSKEVNVNDMVFLILVTIVGHFKRQEQRQGIKLRREKMIKQKSLVGLKRLLQYFLECRNRKKDGLIKIPKL
ncbi:hypothetical protein HDU92_003691 [Lobulomyces angularis]|nr:hypothetical protein HDU92_003691 [Lobulomyces angularis]